ncbi:hypothetical protein HYDPIDRAFT_26878 [Hydnomerulius pinastri MD-312]|nr:hypothetical protein HYDPIDRAFT_26878 [Hydnomerulius pinastri MD-312]
MQDRQQWGSKKPWYTWRLESAKESAKGKKTTGGEKPSAAKRRIPFILDDLVEEGDRLRKQFLGEYRLLRTTRNDAGDPNLTAPWEAARARAAGARNQAFPGFADNLEDIREHVTASFDAFRRAAAAAKTTLPDSPAKDESFTLVAQGFAETPNFGTYQFFSDDDVRTLKASLAASESLPFAFSMAFAELCAIKARAAGNVAFTYQFAQCLSVPNAVLRTFSQAQGSND